MGRHLIQREGGSAALGRAAHPHRLTHELTHVVRRDDARHDLQGGIMTGSVSSTGSEDEIAINRD
jgi:hypothetical protein